MIESVASSNAASQLFSASKPAQAAPPAPTSEPAETAETSSSKAPHLGNNVDTQA